MALVSGGRSTLNPNAPLFIPAAFRQVEDFSPEWWQLVKTSKWYHDYWLQQHQDHDNFDGQEEEEDIVDLLPESFDFGFGEDEFPDAFMEPFQPAEPREPAQLSPKKGIIFGLANLHTFFDLPRNLGIIQDSPKKGLEIGADALIKNLNLNSPKGGARSGVFEAAAKHWEKPAQHVSPKCTPRRIQQPR